MTKDEYKVRAVIEGLERLLLVIPALSTTPAKKLKVMISNIETTLDFLNDKEDRNKW